ncbi:hypothetical protein N7462_005188 [Penicillium macrosclerotiorum]|uniref:uncharacterized protein n=1 Tax=Penicillium macrosclerotiorum TaxID=303699 RepID=UPI002546FA18|nr:uncharacterized protein N7462_005188 [Penicillium macrosclerotiorum]KAJ5690796.1 hypothetical protein N7462_005188 [Penicillium macrosclerotiorum]
MLQPGAIPGSLLTLFFSFRGHLAYLYSHEPQGSRVLGQSHHHQPASFPNQGILAPKSHFRWSLLRPRSFLSGHPPLAGLFSTSHPLFRRDPKPNKLSTLLRVLVGPLVTRRAQNRVWNFRYETLPALRHRAQARLYRAILKRQARLAARNRRFGRGLAAYFLGPRRRLLLKGGRSGLSGSSHWIPRRAGAAKGEPPSGAKNAAKGLMAQSSPWGVNSGDGAGAPGSRRKKAYEWLRAANEVGQAYASRWTSQRTDSQEDYYHTPGAFPDVEIARSGDEEMVLFPSYARRLIPRKKVDTRTRERRDSWSQTIDEYRGISEESNPLGDSWDDPPLRVPRGPMNRKHRLMVKLARTLSGIPTPSGASAEDGADRVPNKGEDEYVDKQMQTLVETAEKDADQAWKNSKGDRTRTSTSQAVAMTKDEISMANAHLMERLRPFLTNPMAGMPVTIFFFNEEESESRNLLTDESGHFNIRAAMPFVPTHIRVLASEDLSAAKPIEIIEPIGISLISDIDDTVKHSAIASGAKEMFRNTFVRELSELTVDGVSEWYTQVAKQGVEIHYVSNAPWQLYPLLERYFKLVGLPPGSFHLKQYTGMLQGIFEPTAERKRGNLEQILRDFPERKFILVGDSGEADLEVYTDIVLANPGRILGIFIRDVTTADDKPFFEPSNSHLDTTAARSQSMPQPLDHADSFAKRPALPPRRPRELRPPPGNDSKSFDNGDLIDLRDEDQLEVAPEIPNATKPRVPPTIPSKPSSLRTIPAAAGIAGLEAVDTQASKADSIRRKPVPPLPPRRTSMAKTDSLIDLEPSPVSRSYTESFANESHERGLAFRSKPPPPPPPRRSNTASSVNSPASSVATTPRPASATKQSYPAAAGAAAQAALNYATERLNFTGAPSPGLRSPASSQSLRRTNTYGTNDANLPPSPLPNKREELWRRRWERASEILGQKGVLLGSWRIGSDVQPVCLWLVEEAMKEIRSNPTQTSAGRKL